MSVHKDEKNKTKDGRMWYFKSSYVDLNGKRKPYKSKKYKTRSEAKDAEAKYLLKKENKIEKIKFSTLANSFFDELSKKRKESTVYTYLLEYNKHIAPYFENCDVAKIKISEIEKWRESVINKNLSIRYLNKLYTVFKMIFDYSKKYGIKDNPVKELGPFEKRNDEVHKDEERIKYITFDEFNQFINTIDDIKWKTFFMFLYYTGCRKGEALALNWNDITFVDGNISINKTLYTKVKDKILITSTKNNINRNIKMSSILKEQLKKYKEEMMKYRDFSENWFVFGNTHYLPLTTIDRYKHKYFVKSGVREITIHEFRHSHVSLLINEYIKKSKNNNMKVDTAKFFLMMSDRMGHSIQVMQNTYMHLFPSIQDEIIDLLDNL